MGPDPSVPTTPPKMGTHELISFRKYFLVSTFYSFTTPPYLKWNELRSRSGGVNVFWLEQTFLYVSSLLLLSSLLFGYPPQRQEHWVGVIRCVFFFGGPGTRTPSRRQSGYQFISFTPPPVPLLPNFPASPPLSKQLLRKKTNTDWLFVLGVSLRCFSLFHLTTFFLGASMISRKNHPNAVFNFVILSLPLNLPVCSPFFLN